MAAKWQRLKIDIPKRYTPQERIAIAQEVVDYVRDRTRSGKGPGNKSWSGEAGKYSQSYMESLAWKVKGGSGRVDLTLSGDMLAALTLLNEKRGQITVGFENGTDENARADGNIRGTYGQNKENPKKARPFLDLTSKELSKILEKYPLKDNEERLSRTTTVLGASEFAEDFIDGEE